MRLDFAKGHTHSRGWRYVDDVTFGFEVFVFVKDFDEDTGLDGKGRGKLEVAATQAEFRGAGGDGGVGRTLWGDLRAGVEYES